MMTTREITIFSDGKITMQRGSPLAVHGFLNGVKWANDSVEWQIRDDEENIVDSTDGFNDARKQYFAVQDAENDNRIENTADALILEKERLGQVIEDTNDAEYLITQWVDVEEEIDHRRREAIRAKYGNVAEYDTHNTFCDDCGRASCICDGGWSVWSDA